MKGIRIFLLITIILTVVMGFSLGTAAEEGQLLGSISIDRSAPIYRMDEDFMPLERIAANLGYDLEWNIEEGRVQGYLEDGYFSTSEFIVRGGDLFLLKEEFRSHFGLEVELRGNRIYIYDYREEVTKEELKLEINTSASNVRRGEPLGVTIMLVNNTGEELDLEFRTGQKYDLILERHGREVWRLSEGRGYTQAIQRETLSDRDYLIFTEIIKPDVRRGRYNLIAEITTADPEIERVETIIQVN